MFTRSNAPKHLWDDEPGIFLRSTASLPQLAHNLRKFIRIPDEKGCWYYIRFYDPRVAVDFLDQTSFWIRFLSHPLPVTAILISGDKATILSSPEKNIKQEAIRIDFDLERRKELRRKLRNNACTAVSEMNIPANKVALAEQVAFDCIERMMGYGFLNSKHLRIFATWELAYGQRYDEHDPEGELLEICKDRSSALRRFKKFTKRMDEVGFIARNSWRAKR